jgi:hypothetical protein
MGSHGEERNPLHALRQDQHGRRLGLDLPAGRLVVESESGVHDEPILWISDARPDAALWELLCAQHHRTGLWPLLLHGFSAGEPDRPVPDLFPELVTSTPADHDAAALLAGWWADCTAHDEDDHLSPAERLAVTAPFENRWPGLAAAGQLQEDPDVLAAQFAHHVLADPRLTAPRLALSPSRRSADAPADLGWSGAVNYENDTARYSAVLRSWEERFGARLVAVGTDTLELSVAAPPMDPEHALHAAAEHFAFCPDNVWQATGHLTGYADTLIDRMSWSFWWD